MCVKMFEEETGICVCCEGLFLSIRDAAEPFGFNLEDVLSDISDVINDKKKLSLPKSFLIFVPINIKDDRS